MERRKNFIGGTMVDGCDSGVDHIYRQTVSLLLEKHEGKGGELF